MRTIKLLIRYDGTAYCGWQIQPNGVSIQGLIQDALLKITGAEVRLTGAGRTDAGVHALEQVAAFNTGASLNAEIFKNALNAHLPEDVRIIDAADADENFHPRFDAKHKTYFYIISGDRVLSPFIARYVWHFPYRLNIETMQLGAQNLFGTHDFSAFRGSGCGAKSTTRTIHEISVEKFDNISFMTTGISGAFIKIRITADAFLRHMVRNIVGTLAEAGRGKITASDIKKIIASKERPLAGPTAPARGLFLEKVVY
ncbi:MAG: tRNA pseudouridine(38-40) synthase TruA [Nitrospirae bacterium]|nr:MAG: tRNA pseudouridine(38-40) synthase TruA [Nitrospirota bacterium]